MTIIDGGRHLRNFLVAATSLTDAPRLELIVAFDASVAETKDLIAKFPTVTFLDLGPVETIYPLSTEAGLHELYDRRRAAGLGVAKGDIIAILEDRGWPRPDWARQIVRLHEETGHNVIGGAIECREPVSRLNWAFYVTDFGQYGCPVENGPASWVSDVNVSYSRKVLDETRHLWKDRYHETIVHGYLMDRGEELYLSNDMVIEHARPPTTLGYLLPERFHWGRLFGYLRAQQFSTGQRIKYILASPLIPPVLWVRHGILQAKKGRGLRYLAALPYVMILTTAWTVGEVWGYITRHP